MGEVSLYGSDVDGGEVSYCLGLALNTSFSNRRNSRMTEYEDRWLSVEEICKYLGISNDTVYRWIDKRDMPASKVGRLWKFKKSEVDEWVKSDGAKEER